MLLSKFFLPELRPNRVDRPRLLERLQHATSGQLVIISAPAGFGKTTLASEWMRTTGENTAWVSLDESDNDPVRFWTGLVTAMDRLFPGAGNNSQSILASRQPAPPQVLLTALLNDVIQQSDNQPVAQPAWLVLDDTHLVNDAAIYEGLLYFVEHLPRNLHLVLIGRSDPPLPLGRLRVSSRVLEIRAADLRFSFAESEDFLNRVMGFHLPQEQVKRLEERTEGWIAGLQLAGLALQGLRQEEAAADKPSAVVNAFIENFSGDDRYVLDYLVEEVLNRLPVEMRTFLLQTSILDRMCGPLCDAVTDLPAGESQHMLERLEHENLFLVSLDTRRQWYRYHHLFADLLRHQLERPGAETMKPLATGELHARAARWLAGQGFLPEAIGQALKGQDFTHAAGWIEAYARNAIDRGEYASLKHWIDALPPAVLYSMPELLMHYAWALAYLGEVTQYELPLAAAEQLWRQQGNLARLGEALNLRADFAATYGDSASAAELAQQALTLLPEEDAYDRGLSWMYVGTAALMQGDLEKAQQDFRMAKALCERGGNATGARMTTLSLAQVQQAQGKLPEAARLVEEVISQIGNLPIYEGLTARVLLSMIWREWGRVDEAEQTLRAVLELLEQTGQVVYFQVGYLYLAIILWQKGDTAGMQQALERQVQLAEQIQHAAGRVVGDTLRAQLAILAGSLETAQAWREINQPSAEDPVTFQNEFIYLTLTRLQACLGAEEARRALALLEKLEDCAQTQQRTASLVEIWMVKALCLGSLHDSAGAVAALESSLALALPGGYQRLYLDEGQPLVELLNLLLRKPSLSPELRAYAMQLHHHATASQGHAVNDGPHSANLALIEPLTPREIEVLRMIQVGLSNREIAEKLYLTLNTVKVHVKNIFAKLDVESRTQAVRRAEELGLV